LSSQAALSITTISPREGEAAGGTLIKIIGAGFTNGTTVKIGGNDASTTVIDNITLIASTPAHAVGTVDVVITNNDGKSI
jgi:IPT/TIG domain